MFCLGSCAQAFSEKPQIVVTYLISMFYYRHFPCLSKVDFSHNSISNEGATYIGKMLIEMKRDLQLLCLDDNKRIGADGILEIASALEKRLPYRLLSLSLDGTSGTPSAYEEFIDRMTVLNITSDVTISADARNRRTMERFFHGIRPGLRIGLPPIDHTMPRSSPEVPEHDEYEPFLAVSYIHLSRCSHNASSSVAFVRFMIVSHLRQPRGNYL